MTCQTWQQYLQGEVFLEAITKFIIYRRKSFRLKKRKRKDKKINPAPWFFAFEMCICVCIDPKRLCHSLFLSFDYFCYWSTWTGRSNFSNNNNKTTTFFFFLKDASCIFATNSNTKKCNVYIPFVSVWIHGGSFFFSFFYLFYFFTHFISGVYTILFD